MDSSEEVSDDILSYLLENATSDSSLVIQGEIDPNVSTATDNEGVHNASAELDNSLNPVTSPSLKSAFSAKKLEWDSSADVGSLPPCKLNEFKSRLSTLERMALSNSASKLCLDEDEQSLALIAKIDRVLARSKFLNKTSCGKSTKKINKLPRWPGIDSGSSASADTVIPQASQKKHQVPSKKQDQAINTDYRNPEPPSDLRKVSSSSGQKHSYSSKTISRSVSQKSTSPAGSEISSQLFVTHSMVGEVDLYASNDLPHSLPITPVDFNMQADGEVEASSSQHCCSPAAYSETTISHTSLSSEHTSRLQREALVGELQIYRGLKEHLQNLKDYVGQLEQTWKFLDQTKAASQYVKSSNKQQRSRRSKPSEVHPTVPPFSDTPSSSTTICTVSSNGGSTPINTGKTSERSFELERLNLHDTDSTDPTTTVATVTTKPSRKAKAKCCAHCSLKASSNKIDKTSSQKKTHPAHVGMQTSNQRPQQVVPQREPVAYEILIDAKERPEQSRRKTTLQEALREKRPDFLQDSERRRQTIQEISYLRREGKVDSNAIPRLFSYHELRQHTEQIYRQLPEANYRNRDQVRRETAVSNRIKASVFQKKLLSRVLHGQLNLPHSTCL